MGFKCSIELGNWEARIQKKILGGSMPEKTGCRSSITFGLLYYITLSFPRKELSAEDTQPRRANSVYPYSVLLES